MPGPQSRLSDFQRGSVAAALYRMLTSERFSICTVRESLRVTHPGLLPDRDPTFLSLKLWACVPFGEMPTSARAALTRHTLSFFPLVFDCADMDELARSAGIEPVIVTATESTATEPTSGDSLPSLATLAPVPHGWGSVTA